MERGFRSQLAAGAVVLLTGVSLALVGAAPAAPRLITAKSVGAARLGMTVATARKALQGFILKRASDGEGLALIAVLNGKKPVMTLYAGEEDPSAPINEKAVIQVIEVTDARYATKAGVHPGMLLKVVERRYGRLKQIRRSEIEAREYAEFSTRPAGMSFRVQGKNDEAGSYKAGAASTSTYTPSAYLYSVSIQERS